MNSAADIVRRVVYALDKSQWLPAHDIEAAQSRQLSQLVLHSERYSPHFRNRIQKAALNQTDLRRPGALAKLPILSRRELQGAKDIFCTAVPQSHLPLAQTQTSGSTGEPVVVKRTFINNIDWLAVTMREHLWHRRDFSGRFCAIRANILALTKMDSWGPPASLLEKTGAALGIPISTPIGEQLDIISAFRPNVLLVYPNILSAFVQEIQTGAAVRPELRQILSIGETLSPELRDRTVATLGVDLADMYSSQEAGIIALQCPQSGLYHVMAENLIVEVVDDDGRQVGEGETGRVVVTDLHNYATPLIRYDIGDFAQTGPRCPCRRGLPTLRRILGRERNLVLMPDGSRHWPMVGFHRYRQIAPIIQYQIVQIDGERMEVRLVCERKLSEAEEEALCAQIRKSLGHSFAMSFRYFDDEIPKNSNGKFEEFVSLVC